MLTFYKNLDSYLSMNALHVFFISHTCIFVKVFTIIVKLSLWFFQNNNVYCGIKEESGHVCICFYKSTNEDARCRYLTTKQYDCFVTCSVNVHSVIKYMGFYCIRISLFHYRMLWCPPLRLQLHVSSSHFKSNSYFNWKNCEIHVYSCL